MESIDPFFVGALIPGGVECDYYFDDRDEAGANGFFRQRKDIGTVERWTGSGWMESESLTEIVAAWARREER